MLKICPSFDALILPKNFYISAGKKPHRQFHVSQRPPNIRKLNFAVFLQTKEALNLLVVACNKLECFVEYQAPSSRQHMLKAEIAL